MKKTNITLLLGFLSILITQSQTIDKYSISGKGTMDFENSFYAEGFDINAYSKSFMYTIGYYSGEEYSPFEVFNDQPNEKYNQVSLLFGKYMNSKNKLFRFQYQGGIGLFWGIKRSDELDTSNSTFITNHYYTEKFTTVGIPLQVGYRFIPLNFLSIGVDLQANLNFEKSIVRPMLSIEIGKLRSSKNEQLNIKTE